MESKRVVVTGLGAITPIGNTLKDFWEGLVKGKNGACEITRFDSTLFKTHFACEVKGYNPDDFFDKKTARKYDLFAQFGIVAAAYRIASDKRGSIRLKGQIFAFLCQCGEGIVVTKADLEKMLIPVFHRKGQFEVPVLNLDGICSSFTSWRH